MVVTLAQLVSYAKGLDSRIAAKTDEQVHPTIKYSVHNIATQLLCFYKTDTFPLSNFMTTNDIVTLSEDDVINIYELSVVNASDEKQYPLGVEYRVLADNTIEIKISPELDTANLYFNVRYFYSPDIVTEGSMNWSTEVYHLWKHSVNVVVWGGLKDYEKEQYHQKVMDEHFRTTTLTYPNDLPLNSLKGGFQ